MGWLIWYVFALSLEVWCVVERLLRRRVNARNSAIHQTSRVKNLPYHYQPLLIKTHLYDFILWGAEIWNSDLVRFGQKHPEF